MFQQVVGTLFDILNDVFLNRDVFRAVAAVVIAVVAGMVLSELKPAKLVRMVVICLALFALVLGLQDLLNDVTRNNRGADAFLPWLDESANALLNLRLGVILVYFVAFAVVVSVAHWVGTLIKGKK